MRRSAVVDIIGRACRLPGARDVAALLSVLRERRCTVGEIGDDRWVKARFYNPRRGERGKSYTFAAGVIEDVWGFDPAVFGLSPREAENMDPQQRVLLEVVWEALEDAGVPPSLLAGQNVGVYVGVSSPDTATRRANDVGSADAYTMTGSTLSLVANRISYVFDWHGPSFSVDTACSSSLVAFSQALDALQAGQIDTAVVAGVNMLLSPFPFLGFAAARMLAPDGRCRPFDADGQGYVRAEGAVALVLRRRDAARIGAGRRYAEAVAAAVNSDGRTSGVSLPSAQAQAALLGALYARAGIDAEMLAFVEAHGTGTRVGDPAEAEAIGTMLGKPRTRPLPIGSIKSNIGHLEPAAGLAGVMKALLALEHGVLPASLHFRTPNPAIPFRDLNIAVAGEPVQLEIEPGVTCAGVSAFGFGGTNAHVILRSAEPGERAPKAAAGSRRKLHVIDTAQPGAGVLMLSAQCQEGLVATARTARSLIEARHDAAASLSPIAAAYAAEREQLPERLAVVAGTQGEGVAALDRFIGGQPCAQAVTGRGVGRSASIAFVYTGNGSQWAGMGRLAYEANASFRSRFDALSDRFAALAGWSLKEALHAEDLADRLGHARTAQPLLFAIQAALTDALAALGLEPSLVLGHSVGEIAAAYACGALDEACALRVIAARSASQELCRGSGTMAALALSEDEARSLIAECAAPGVEIGAINSPRSVTLTGPTPGIEACAERAAAKGHRVKVLDLAYPFHSALVDVARDPLLADLEGIAGRAARVPFVSTVTGDVLPGEALDAEYWWRNVRSPVRFGDGVARAAALGARVFVEISPRSILQGYLAESLGEQMAQSALVPSLGAKDEPSVDPVRITLARALVRGARVDTERTFGRERAAVRLPLYAWQNKPYDVTPSGEASALMLGTADRHRYLGWRERTGVPQWFNHFDTDLMPELADHRIGGQVYVPGAVLAEMAIAAARAWLGEQRAEVYDLDILAPLVLSADHMRETRTAIEPGIRSLQIASRRRFSDEEWQVHVEARIGPATDVAAGFDATSSDASPVPDFAAPAFYDLARRLGLDYGPHFRRLESLALCEDGSLVAGILPASGVSGDLLLDPIGLDVAFHGLLCKLLGPAEGDPPSEGYVPVRFGRIIVHAEGREVRSARLRIARIGITTARCDVHLLDVEGQLVASVLDARFKASTFLRARPLSEVSVRVTAVAEALPGVTPELALPSPAEIAAMAAKLPQPDAIAGGEEARLLLEAAARRAAIDVLNPLAVNGAIAPQKLVETGRLSSQMLPAVHGLLTAMEATGIACGDGRVWTLSDSGAALPALDAIVQTVIADHPEWWPDCAMLAEAAAAWPARIAQGVTGDRALPYSSGVLEAFAVATPRVRNPAEVVETIVARSLGAAGDHPEGARPVRMLEIGASGGALTVPLARLLGRLGGELVAVDEDARAIDKLRSQLSGSPHVKVVEPAALAGVAGGGFDMIVSAGGLHRLADLETTMRAARSASRAGTRLVAIATSPSTFHDVVLGLDPAWFATEAPTSDRQRPPQPLTTLRRKLKAAGFEILEPGDDTGLLVGAASSDTAVETDAGAAREGGVSVAALASAPCALTASIERAVAASGGDGSVVERQEAKRKTGQGPLWAAIAKRAWRDLVLVSPATPATAAPEPALRERLASLTSLLRALGEREGRIWIVAPGSLRDVSGDGPGDPVNAAVAGFARTATNEMPALDIRVVDHAADLYDAGVAHRVAALIASPGRETEIILGRKGLAVLRTERGVLAPDRAAAGAAPDAAARLDLSRDPGGERLQWHRIQRRAPAAGEVEISVAATGLNFRDCMWSMGLLPEEALEDGFAGPTLGFECSGRIVRVGPGVTHLEAGQSVIAFAPAAFASHVTVDANAVAPVPAHMDLTAAATVPVPFITAYYALEYLARLEPGESVLIHGGAGGVGLAALQIAKWRGAVVFATAGSEDKRRLLTLLGADHVLDSRSLAFAGEIMALTNGAGVDVVLNSLAGEAMERSLALVRPFGRFLELGKRDYYGSTKIGLRPFRRNVSYYGIDADQLLAQKPELSRRLFADLSKHLAEGTFVPLPYRRFAAEAVGDAFRLMQQSGHIGKIVVTAPAPEAVPAAPGHETFAADAEGAHVVIGGLGGFGLATGRWLIESGARRIVLVSRSGKPADADAEKLAALQHSGADVSVESADVSDEAQLAALLDRVRAKGPISGVIHAAMVLDDDFISNLDKARIGKVLAPKVSAAAHLDRLTRGDTLQYFVLYSSVTVLLGNPGQAAYVAANAYLEALARQRRAEGLPALAVGWGGITDTGYLARNADVSRAIERRTGTASFTADEALKHLGELLSLGTRAPACVTVAPMSWGAARDQLPLLGKPLFSRLLVGEASGGAARSETVNIAAEINGLDEAGAREIVVRHLAEEVARIFRMPVADVSPSRSLAELGMDSLMGLELRLAVQQRLGADIPLSAMSGNQTLADISARIAATLRGGERTDEPRVGAVNADLVHQHVAAGMDAEKLAPLLREIDRRDTTTAGAR